jgi:cell division protein FtsB
LEFSFDKQQDTDTSHIANERLRKAIERNRQRQKEREQKEVLNKDNRPETQEVKMQQEFKTSFHTSPPPPPPLFDEVESRSIEDEPIVETVTRRTVAKPDDTEFIAVKRSTKRTASALNYHTTSSRKKSKPMDPSIIKFFTKAAWIFAAFLIFRLIFARGGVTDFYSQHSILSQKQNDLNSIKTENMQLVREIERMYSDSGFQKKLVRDNLGFIASDEFLILFPKE